jgi:large subunit ribosomal protein L33
MPTCRSFISTPAGCKGIFCRARLDHLSSSRGKRHRQPGNPAFLRETTRFQAVDSLEILDFGRFAASLPANAGLTPGRLFRIPDIEGLHMAKAVTIKVKLVSSADTGFYYVAKKNSRTMTDKMVKKKYDPVARKHVEFREAKIK